MVTLNTDINVEPLKGTYIPIAPRSGLDHEQKLHVLAGVINPDYRGQLEVMLQNPSDTDITITQGTRISQMICEQAIVPKISITKNITPTTRDQHRIANTEENQSPPTPPIKILPPLNTPYSSTPQNYHFSK